MGIQISRWFIRKNNLRIYHKRSRYTDSLLLSARHLVWHMFLMLSKIYKIQHLIRFF